MKKTFILIIFHLYTLTAVFAQLRSEVNETFELTSLVFRLAGASEYINNTMANYTLKTDDYFKGYNDHKLISYTKELREKQKIAYDAPANAAAHLEIKDGNVIIRPNLDLSKISEIDDRWSEETFKTFASLLNDFYKDTKFGEFYQQHLTLYKIAEERLNELLKSVNLSWFDSFLGKSLEEPWVITSILNGPNNYAFSTLDGKIGVVLGCSADNEDLPLFKEQFLSIILHELLHSCATPLIEECWEQVDSAAHVIYSHVSEDMHRRAYKSAQVTMSEWLTNLFAVMYIQDNPIKNLDTNLYISWLQNSGFIWIKRSVAFMEHYRNNRNMFATIDDYKSQIIEFIKYTAINFNKVLNEFHNRRPYIVDIFPLPGSTVQSVVDTIKICFSEPMNDIHSLSPVNEDVKPIPYSVLPFWQDDYTYIIVLKKEELEKGERYGSKLNHSFFRSRRGYTLDEDYIYTFTINDL